MKKGLEYFQKVLQKMIPDFWKGKSPKLLFRDGGETKYQSITIINIIACLLIFGINLIDQINKNQSLIERWDKTIPFLLMAVFCYLANNKIKFTSYLYAFCSIMALISTREEANLTGAIFLIYSLYLFNSNIMNGIMIISTFIAIGSKVFFGFSGNQLMALIMGYGYVLIIYYILIHPKKKIQSGPEIIYTELEQEDIQILQYLYEGYSIKEISDRIYITPGAINKRMSRAKETMNAKTRDHLLAICREKRFIRLNVDK